MRNLETLSPLTVALRSEGETPPEMTLVLGGDYPVRLNGFHTREVISLDEFLIDRYEVTNGEYKEFVDAGGYSRPEFWSQPDFVKDGRRLSWEEAMATFVDTTDRAGPATWEFGDYPEGTAGYPVRGVSWYEAVAYAEFRGKTLPTVFHWARAAMSPGEHLSTLSAELIPASNFGGEGPARVGEFGGVGPYGTYDMAGNVREWVWNVGGDHRWVLGGAWNDPVYMSSVRTDLPPFDRSPENGFRCVRYLGGEPLSDALAGPVETQSPDYRAAQPASDEVFDAYTRQFSYFPTPLNATIESTDDSPTYWTRERVSFDAAYEDERVIAQLVLPKRGGPHPLDRVSSQLRWNPVHDSSCLVCWLSSSPSVSVRLLRRPVVERRVGPAPVVEVHPPADSGPSLGTGCELGQVDAFVRERSPQPLDEHVVHPAALAVHRDADASLLEHVGEVDAGELAALVAIKDLRRAIALERLVQGVHAEARIERVGQAPGQDLAARPVHHRDEVQKASLSWDIGNIRAPHVVRPRDLQIA